MKSYVMGPVATPQMPPNPCWIIRNPLESASLRVAEGLLVFSSYERGAQHAQQANLSAYSVNQLLWNDLVEGGRYTYSSAVIDYDADAPLVILPMEKVEGWPSTQAKVWPPGTPLLVETGTVNVPGYDLFKILDCFPITRKPREEWLTKDENHIQNHEWDGVAGKAFGGFHYQAWGTFRGQFMQDEGKIEENIPPATLHIYELTQEVLLEKIAATLGEQAEIKMGQIVGLMSQQPKGEPGTLDTEGVNLFFVRIGPEDEFHEGELSAVQLYWDDSHGEPHRWRINEDIIGNVHPRRPGTRVFST